jgi:hypothetical protein
VATGKTDTLSQHTAPLGLSRTMHESAPTRESQSTVDSAILAADGNM